MRVTAAVRQENENQNWRKRVGSRESEINIDDTAKGTKLVRNGLTVCWEGELLRVILESVADCSAE